MSLFKYRTCTHQRSANGSATGGFTGQSNWFPWDGPETDIEDVRVAAALRFNYSTHAVVIDGSTVDILDWIEIAPMTADKTEGEQR